MLAYPSHRAIDSSALAGRRGVGALKHAGSRAADTFQAQNSPQIMPVLMGIAAQSRALGVGCKWTDRCVTSTWPCWGTGPRVRGHAGRVRGRGPTPNAGNWCKVSKHAEGVKLACPAFALGLPWPAPAGQLPRVPVGFLLCARGCPPGSRRLSLPATGGRCSDQSLHKPKRTESVKPTATHTFTALSLHHDRHRLPSPGNAQRQRPVADGQGTCRPAFCASHRLQATHRAHGAALQGACHEHSNPLHGAARRRRIW